MRHLPIDATNIAVETVATVTPPTATAPGASAVAHTIPPSEITKLAHDNAISIFSLVVSRAVGVLIGNERLVILFLATAVDSAAAVYLGDTRLIWGFLVEV